MSYNEDCVYLSCLPIPLASVDTPICNSKLLLIENTTGNLKLLNDGTTTGRILATNSVSGCIEWADPCDFLEATTRFECLSDVTITAGAPGDMVYYDGAQWINSRAPFYDENPANSNIVTTATSSAYGTGSNIISGGFNNMILAGTSNNINASNSAVLSGEANVINGSHSSVLAGTMNDANGINTVISGNENTTFANNSAIIGGSNNTISLSAISSGIFGGTSNTISATALRSVILGGSSITATAPDTVYMQNCDIVNKLTVGGIIDPTGLVLSDQLVVPQNPTSTQGTLWTKTNLVSPNNNTVQFTDSTLIDNTLLGYPGTPALNDTVRFDGTRWQLVSSSASTVEHLYSDGFLNEYPTNNAIISFTSTDSGPLPIIIGFLFNGNYDGQIKHIIGATLPNVYYLDVTTNTIMYSANGMVINHVVFDTRGIGISIVWNSPLSAWFILTSGAPLSFIPPSV
jgi:hypothetical protein